MAVRLFALLAAFSAAFMVTSTAHAFSRGVAFHGCDGCHGSGEQQVMLMPLDDIEVGTSVTMRLRVTGLEGSELGFFVDTELGSIAPGSGAKRNGDGITHDGPPRSSGGSIELEFEWTPVRGAERISVSTLDADGDNRSRNDGGAYDTFDFVAGCEGQTYYLDQDGDDFGGERERIFCAGEPGDGYAAETGDCNDFRDTVFPGADEPCNQRDDDCNGTIDDDAEDALHYPDADGDGFYSFQERESGEEFFGCSEPGGPWAARAGDCDPTDPEINPDAEEVCDLRDNDCDGDVDERTRPQCGTGWCRRNSNSCDVEDCTPGPPEGETCNLFDDDCDGVVDEDSCPAGSACVDFECVEGATMPGSDAGTGDGGSGGDSGGCSINQSTSSSAGALLLLAFVVLERRRRR